MTRASVIRGFGPRITAIFQENAGPRVACNVGFAASTGDVVIFLDSDDVLDPVIAREVAAVWRPGISKVQVQMQRIDAAGRRGRRSVPRVPARTHAPSRSGTGWPRPAAYPTPPGSGNAYARYFLDRLFPLDDRCGDATDSACLAAAPFLGDVVTIAKPLVRYRLHGDNRSRLAGDPAVCPRRSSAPCSGTGSPTQVGRSRAPGSLAPLLRSRHLLQMRVAERRVLRGRPAVADRQPAADAPRQLRQPRWRRDPSRSGCGWRCWVVRRDADRAPPGGPMADPPPLRLRMQGVAI